MSSLSVCIVTQNEEKNIEETLSTIAFADEIIIVDSYSYDATVEICKRYTNKIYLNTWEGCGLQKSFALSKATSEWILLLDADERLSPELQIEIQNSIKNPGKYSGFIIKFQTFYLGKAIRYGDWYKEQHLRLFKRKQGEVIKNYVHFGLKVIGDIGKLNGLVKHNSYPNVETILNKTNLYSTLGAKDKLKSGESAGILKAICHGLFTFVRSYILKLGFLDGKYGFMLAISNAEASYYKYIKLMILATSNQTNICQQSFK